MAAKKPTKQQIAQAKARAGGNTTSKTTPARMAKGAKDIALFAATIAGPGKVAKVATTAAKAISRVRAGGAGREGAGKIATKIGDKLSGASSKRVQQKMHDIAVKDWKQTAKNNPDLNDYDAYLWSKHPAMVSGKGFDRAVNKGKTVTDRQSVRYRKAEERFIKKTETRALKAANKKKSK